MTAHVKYPLYWFQEKSDIFYIESISATLQVSTILQICMFIK